MSINYWIDLGIFTFTSTEEYTAFSFFFCLRNSLFFYNNGLFSFHYTSVMWKDKNIFVVYGIKQIYLNKKVFGLGEWVVSNILINYDLLSFPDSKVCRFGLCAEDVCTNLCMGHVTVVRATMLWYKE